MPKPKARRLVVGGGRRRGYPPLKPDDVALNVAAAAKPDVRGDIAHAPFADSCFDEVFFEFVPFQAFTGRNLVAIRESARLLHPGGRLLIHTGRSVNIEEVVSAMRRHGFRWIRVTDRGYIRITARLRRAKL